MITTDSKDHIRWMKKALQMAGRGMNWTSPNPKVGAIIVRNGRLIAKGYHQKFGGPHAEVNVLNKCKGKLEKAVLYVTLEPCSTYGKTPPCTEAILQSGIRRVVVGCLDPNPVHQGRGVRLLEKKGIQVEIGVLEKQCKEMIRPFEKWIRKKIPFCVVKAAMSFDGKIATSSGQSKWITGEKAREKGHELRAYVDAILAGIRTVIKDDPGLMLHGVKGKEPFKVILDSDARIPLQCQLIKKNPKKVILAVSKKVNRGRIEKLRDKGVTVFEFEEKEGEIPLLKLFKKLGKIGIASVLVEGGGQVNASIFREKLADRIYFFYGPVLIGGKDSITAFEGIGIKNIQDSVKIQNVNISKMGRDFMVTGDVRY